jgi:hypothetical protein
MGKMRIVVTCPETGIAVITSIAYEDMVKPRKGPMLFACPCGETHTLLFAGRASGQHRHPPVTLDNLDAT